MLTKRQNLLETIRGGKPDRYVNQYEALAMVVMNPYMAHNPQAEYGKGPVKNAWGVTNVWPEGTPGGFPIHDEEHIVCKDITHWKDYVHAPSLDYSDADWEPFVKEAEKIDRKEYFVTQCLMNFYEEPEATQELIDYLTDWELQYAEKICKYIKPDAIFHHDDWGSQTSTFISPAMFEEFILPAYKKIYGYYKSHGVELIIHHSDSYAATLVPYMIEMGVDIWQGTMSSNNIPELIQKYGGQIVITSEIENYPGGTEGETGPSLIERMVQQTEHFGCEKVFDTIQERKSLPEKEYPTALPATPDSLRISRFT